MVAIGASPSLMVIDFDPGGEVPEGRSGDRAQAHDQGIALLGAPTGCVLRRPACATRSSLSVAGLPLWRRRPPRRHHGGAVSVSSHASGALSSGKCVRRTPSTSIQPPSVIAIEEPVTVVSG